MYEEADPPLDFNQMLKDHKNNKKTVATKKDWYSNYYLSIERQEQIFDEIIKKYKCSPYERKKISFEIRLGLSPSMSKD